MVKFENTQFDLVRSKAIARSPTDMKLFMNPGSFISNGPNRSFFALLIAELWAFDRAMSEKDNLSGPVTLTSGVTQV